MRVAQLKWEEKYHFPYYAIGAIDSTHVQIKKCNDHGDGLV